MIIRPVILCGGSGSRLWPLSRTNTPKQFIPIYNNKTLFDMTLLRSIKLYPNVVPIIVTNIDYIYYIKDALLKYKAKAKIIVEPAKKNTTAAIYFAALSAIEEEYLLIMPSDHLIPDDKYFKKTFDNIKINKNNWLTLGVKPTTPSEAYGYINIENKKNSNNLYKVKNFIEKPNTAEAIKMLSEGTFYWNSGIFLSKKETIIETISVYANDIAIACDKTWINTVKDKENSNVFLNSIDFNAIRSESIDYAVMEKYNEVVLFPFETIWSDIGSWDSFSNNIQDDTDIYSIDSHNNSIYCGKKLVATIGINNIIVIDTEDCLLITKKGSSEKVKDILEKVKINKKKITEVHYNENRPWGSFKVLENDIGFKVKKLIINSSRRLSYQYHNHRSEHWFIVRGEATIKLDDKLINLKEGNNIFIPQGKKHYIENQTNKELIIIELQFGDYLEEDDIIRIDDPYKRPKNVI